MLCKCQTALLSTEPGQAYTQRTIPKHSLLSQEIDSWMPLISSNSQLILTMYFFFLKVTINQVSLFTGDYYEVVQMKLRHLQFPMAGCQRMQCEPSSLWISLLTIKCFPTTCCSLWDKFWSVSPTTGTQSPWNACYGTWETPQCMSPYQRFFWE